METQLKRTTIATRWIGGPHLEEGRSSRISKRMFPWLPYSACKWLQGFRHACNPNRGHGSPLTGDVAIGKTVLQIDQIMKLREVLSQIGRIRGNLILIVDSCYSGNWIQASETEKKRQLGYRWRPHDFKIITTRCDSGNETQSSGLLWIQPLKLEPRAVGVGSPISLPNLFTRR